MFAGSQEGIDVWYKLGTSEDEGVRAYFEAVRNASQKYGSAWFSDLVEQRKKKLNNQKTFFMYYSQDDKKWHIDLFHEPKDI